jgi:hypothetical protein
VNRAETETFRGRARDLLAHYENSLAQLEQDYARQNGLDWNDVKGHGREIALEAHARAYVIDPLLNALGWNVSSPGVIVVEDGVNAAQDNQDGHRRRLDYHGRENYEGRSLLIVEAKRPEVGLPQPGTEHLEELIAQSLATIKASGTPPVSAAWREILSTAIDYAKRVMDRFGEAPKTIAITNGDWFVVFDDVSATLLAEEPASTQIVVFNGLNDVAIRADTFCTRLSYSSLSGHVPPQPPEALANFIPEGHEAICARVVDVSYGRHGDRQPILSMRVGMWIRTPSGAWILFRREYRHNFVLLHDDQTILRTSRDELTRRAEDLFNALARHRPIRVASTEEFETSPPARLGLRRSAARTSSLMQDLESDRYADSYRVVTVGEVLFITDDATFDSCRYHDWGTCRTSGQAVGGAPIVEQSTDPRCFFPSGSPYHCAHAAIQARREAICLLLAFEQRLCCRRCAFLRKCWSDTAGMPCRQD